MPIYERLGVRPIINVTGTFTVYGSALMGEEALEAMNEAARKMVRLDELQAAASKVIAQITHAEAGIVTAGASAALTLGTAACIAGFDVARMNRLPDTTGVPNEVIMPWHHITTYTHAIWLAGARMIWVGMPAATTKWDIGSAITESTVAIAYVPRLDGQPPLEEVIEVGKKYNIPVILDAANQVPPVENLHRFIDMGVDLVCFSGGKGIRGPQASGILCGCRDLVASAVVQQIVGGESFDKWDPPASLIPKEKLRGKPEQGIGRGMKVTKEAIVGLLVTLQDFSEENVAKRVGHLRQLLGGIEARLASIAGVEMRMTTDNMGDKGGGEYPVLEVRIDKQAVGRGAAEVSQRLKDGEPSIYAYDRLTHKGLVYINSINLDEEIARTVGERFYTAITGE